MFSSDVISPNLVVIRQKLLKEFTPELLRKCEKIIDKRQKEPTFNILPGEIMTKCNDINGMSKKVFMKRINQVFPYIPKDKTDQHRSSAQLIEVLIKSDPKLSNYSDNIDDIRKIFFYVKPSDKTFETWIFENIDDIINYITKPKFKTHSIVDIEETCFTISIIALKCGDIFKLSYIPIINFLVNIVCECCKYVQAYISLRDSKVKDNYTQSSFSDNNAALHFPFFRFPYMKCDNKLFSIAYYTIAFCLDNVISPDMILYLIDKAITVQEVCRYYLITLIRLVILKLDVDLCKTDSEWINFPIMVHNEMIKFYMDKNVKIRNYTQDISTYIKKCSKIKLPFITKPVKETMEDMIRKIEQDKLKASSFKISPKNQVIMWKELLGIDEGKVTPSDHSSSTTKSDSEGQQTKSYSSKLDIDQNRKHDASIKMEDKTNKEAEEDDEESLEKDRSDKSYNRLSLTIPTLSSIIEITHLQESMKLRQSRKKRRKNNY